MLPNNCFSSQETIEFEVAEVLNIISDMRLYFLGQSLVTQEQIAHEQCRYDVRLC